VGWGVWSWFPPVKTYESEVIPRRYAKLETLLKAKNFREADLETDRVMLAVAKRQSEGWLRIKDAENFPCKELCTIDNLWLKYSQGKFGISVQQKIYRNLGGTWCNFDVNVWRSFGDSVGWRKQGSWLSIGDLNFSLSAPTGHLPTCGELVWGGWLVLRNIQRIWLVWWLFRVFILLPPVKTFCQDMMVGFGLGLLNLYWVESPFMLFTVVFVGGFLPSWLVASYTILPSWAVFWFGLAWVVGLFGWFLVVGLCWYGREEDYPVGGDFKEEIKIRVFGLVWKRLGFFIFLPDLRRYEIRRLQEMKSLSREDREKLMNLILDKEESRR
ncbi:GUN4 domain-containing protein, partial [Cylindrospermopsis raciborskii]